MCSTLCIFLNVLEPDGLYPFYSFKVSVFIYPYISLPNVSWELAVAKPGSQCLVCRTVVLKITQWFSLVGPEAQCGWGTGPRSHHIRQKAKVKQNLWGHGAKVFTAVRDANLHTQLTVGELGKPPSPGNPSTFPQQSTHTSLPTDFCCVFPSSRKDVTEYHMEETGGQMA